MNMKRRGFLKGTLAASVVGVAAGAGLLAPRRVWAAWNKTAFSAKKYGAALKAAEGTDHAIPSKAIVLRAPDIAENGAVVPVTVSSNMKGVQSINVFVDKNPFPLNAAYDLPAGTESFVSYRLKMAKTSEVVAVVKANGKLYSTKRLVKVTIGGCGG
ncbi:MAG: thiosulfate oxidation carrier protein SoxY [Gammaproteobacteria bacterium]|nr:thiosulfate oxidation carrier protein SoxY [Gammaproteobacteria bacterium]